MRGSDYIFESVKFLYYKCHQLNFKHGGGGHILIHQTNWIKKVTINPKITDDKYFQYAVTVTLKY